MEGLAVDPQFVVPIEHRPGRSPVQDEIPVIDLQGVHEVVVAQTGKAAEEWGFFQVINHGVPGKVLSDLDSAAGKFFGLPLEEKRLVSRDAENFMGYNDKELTKNVRDWKEVFDYYREDSKPVELNQRSVQNRWPSHFPEFRTACNKYAEEVEALAFRVLELLCESLGLPPKSLHAYFEPTTSRVRLNHYGKCPAPEKVLGLNRHKDGCALTVLGQDQVEGLEVKRKGDEWIRVKPIQNAFAVNVGDLMQVWSNDKYQSVEHRVVANSEAERFSWPLFFGPSYKTQVSPVPDLLDATSNPSRYRPVNWGDYFQMRRDSNFKNLGRPNVQIGNWAIQY